MTKTTYKRKHLIGRLFMTSEGESMTITVGSLAADGKHGTGAAAETLYLIHKLEAEGKRLNLV